MSILSENNYQRDMFLCEEIFRVHERFVHNNINGWSFREDAYLVFYPKEQNLISYYYSSAEQKKQFLNGNIMLSYTELDFSIVSNLDLSTEEGYFQGSLVLDKHYLTVYTIFQYLNKHCTKPFSLDMISFMKGFKRKYENRLL